MTRSETLDKAKACVCGQRENEYGSPEDNFTAIAGFWSVYKGVEFTANDVAMMMALLKIARIRTGTASKVSYRNYYDQGTDRVRAGSVGNRRNTPDYDDILFDTRGDAEAVLDAMNDIISQYGTVSVSDFYDLARVPNDNFTMNRYGWTNIGGATAVRVRDGYILKLPRAIPLN